MDTSTSSAMATKTLTAQCYCKSIHFTLTLPTSSLPLKTHLCHCSVCRHVHGMLCCFHAPLPSGIHPDFVSPSSKDNLTAYPTRNALRYFCSTCGCHIGDSDNEGKDEWVISSSIFEPSGDSGDRVWDFGSHIYADENSTRDGGLAVWLPEIGGKTMKHINLDPPGEPTPQAPPPPEPVKGRDGEDRLLAQCHCGGISFTISRPDPSKLALHEPLQKIPSARDPAKYRASIDFCDECRLQTGTHITAWTFVAASATSPRIPPSLQIGTAKTYQSSPGVLRAFCSVCGASVFYTTAGKTFEDGELQLDVMVGVLRAPEGVRAEKWLDWNLGSGSYEKDGENFDKVFADAVREGMRRWGLEKNGEGR